MGFHVGNRRALFGIKSKLGPELLSTAGTGVMDDSNWAAVGSTVLSNPSAGILRVEHGGTASPAAQQNIGEIGKTYRVVGEARSDGVGTPRVMDNFTPIWVGTTSTSWQSFSVDYTFTSIIFRLQALNVALGEYCEFRNMSVKEVL